MHELSGGNCIYNNNIIHGGDQRPGGMHGHACNNVARETDMKCCKVNKTWLSTCMHMHICSKKLIINDNNSYTSE